MRAILEDEANGHDMANSKAFLQPKIDEQRRRVDNAFAMLNHHISALNAALFAKG